MTPGLKFFRIPLIDWMVNAKEFLEALIDMVKRATSPIQVGKMLIKGNRKSKLSKVKVMVGYLV
jgi:hypothetical protein